MNKTEAKFRDWEGIAMHMITYAGSAKSDAMEALFLAKKGEFEEAKSKLKHADIEVAEAARTHFDIIVDEAGGEAIDFRVLFMHAEDQLLSTQTIMTLANEFVALYERLAKLELPAPVAPAPTPQRTTPAEPTVAPQAPIAPVTHEN